MKVPGAIGGAAAFVARFEGLKARLQGDGDVREAAAELLRRTGLPGPREGQVGVVGHGADQSGDDRTEAAGQVVHAGDERPGEVALDVSAWRGGWRVLVE